MKRELSLTEAMLIALILLLMGFLTVDHTIFRAMKVEFLHLEESGQKPDGPIKFTFVDLPDDQETENPDATRYSDISRRAAGGSGPAATEARSQGNSPEIVIKPTPAPSRPQPRQDPAPASQAQAEHALDQSGETENEEPGSSHAQSQPNPKMDMSRMFTATDPKIYNNPEGGLVIPGNFSIDTQGFDLGPYAKRIQQIVRTNWKIPQVARNLYLSGRVEVIFNIWRDGSITDIKLGSTTGFEPLDKSGEFAIRYSNPLPPLPSFVTEDKISVKWTFYYNEKPED